MNRATALLRSSVGRKLLMAVTGFGLLGFLVVHMIGNLYVFQGRDALNAYAAWLQEHPLLWPARLGLLAIFVLHTWLGLSLAWENRRARPQGYRRRLDEPADVRFMSRHMALTGLVVLAFLLYHLAHFTFGVVGGVEDRADALGRHDVFGMVVAGFRNPWIVGTYAAAMLVLALHLFHAGQSFLQTLGIRYRYTDRLVKGAGLGLVAVIIAGNLAIPILVYLGLEGPGDLATMSAAITPPAGVPELGGRP